MRSLMKERLHEEAWRRSDDPLKFTSSVVWYIDSIWHTGNILPKVGSMIIIKNRKTTSIGIYDGMTCNVDVGPFSVKFTITPTTKWAYLEDIEP